MCEGGRGRRGGGAATKEMMTTDTRSMETRSMGISSSGARRRGMAWRLHCQVVIGRWIGARCFGGGLVG